MSSQQPPSIIRDPKGLLDLTRRLREAGSFVLDTEFIRERTYTPRLCLIQVATADGALIVDPQLLGDLSPFLDLIFDPSVEKVLHSGEQDMEIFQGLGQRLPRNVVDTQVAAALAGHGESVSYGRIVEELLGVRLRKAETFTDWSRRPLTLRQVEYALDDVRYLAPVLARLRGELASLGRLEWLREELLFYEDPATYERRPELAFRRVRSASRLEPRELAVLRELAAWREEEAEAVDWPRGKVIQDEVLVELARRAPTTIESVGAVRGIHQQLVKRSGTKVLSRVARALALPPSEYPQPFERVVDDPELSLVVDFLDLVLRARAAKERIAPSYLATRKDLVELARWALESARAGDAGSARAGEAPLPPLSRGWRLEIAGKALLECLRGRLHCGIDPQTSRVTLLASDGRRGEQDAGPRHS